MTGTVAALWRYPVKSMGGEEVDASAVGERGLAGDRVYAVADRETGRVASAKHPRRWAALLACRAAFVAPPVVDGPPPPVRITLPDGAEVASDEPRVHDVLSRLLGRPVRLVTSLPPGATREADRSPVDDLDAGIVRDEPLALAAPAGTFFDVAPLHLLTAATLAALARRAAGSRFDARRFRPNLVVEGADDGEFPEIGSIGRSVRVGSADLRIIDPAPRCVVTTLRQGDLPRDPAVLRTVAGAASAASATLAPGVVFPSVAGGVRTGGAWRRPPPRRPRRRVTPIRGYPCSHPRGDDVALPRPDAATHVIAAVLLGHGVGGGARVTDNVTLTGDPGRGCRSRRLPFDVRGWAWCAGRIRRTRSHGVDGRR